MSGFRLISYPLQVLYLRMTMVKLYFDPFQNGPLEMSGLFDLDMYGKLSEAPVQNIIHLIRVKLQR